MAVRSGCVTLCWPNWIDRASVSGGAWKSEFPLVRLADPVVAKAARSESLDFADTQVDITFDKFRPVGVIALMNHNISAKGEWRITLYADVEQTDVLWESGLKDVWPTVYAMSELEWEYDNFWSGQLEQDDIDRFTSLATEFITEGSSVVRSAKIEIQDSSNPDGFIRIGRVFISDVWQPAYSAQYGIEYGFEIKTTFETADDRAMTEYADARTPRRTVSFVLATLDQEEGFRRTLAMQRDQGIHKEVLYTESPTPTVEGFHKTFIGRMDNVSPLTHPYYQTFSNSINLVEIL